MTALPSKSDLVRGLQAALPRTSMAQLERLATILIEAQVRTEPHLSDESLRELLRCLAGSTLNLGSSAVQFGSGSQFGDVTFRDVAGRDIVHTTIITAEQAYNVAGLPNPYLDLRAFSYEDRDRFAGREQIIREAVERLTTPGSQQTILFITGASGSGKSSLVQAGIVPALECVYAKRNIQSCRAVMRPGTQPIASLGAALDTLAWPCGGDFAAADPFRLTNPAIPSGPPAVGIIVLDQAEELFRAEVDVPQREDLIALLSRLLPFSEQRLHIIVTLRADFLPDLFAYPMLYQIAKRGIDLYAMREEQLQDAIQRPVQVRYPEKRLEPALVERLAYDAAQDAALLPLLQVTLEDLWRRGTMILGHYGSLIDALRDRADVVMDYIDHDGSQRETRPDSDRDTILSIFLDLVAVSLDEDPRHDVRRRQTLAALVGDNVAEGAQRRRLIGELCAARGLVAGVEVRDGCEVEVIDIIHESLLTRWPRLSAAITERRDNLQQRERFTMALNELLGI